MFGKCDSCGDINFLKHLPHGNFCHLCLPFEARKASDIFMKTIAEHFRHQARLIDQTGIDITKLLKESPSWKRRGH